MSSYRQDKNKTSNLGKYISVVLFSEVFISPIEFIELYLDTFENNLFLMICKNRFATFY